MTNYIYDLDVTLLRLCYMCPEKYIVTQVNAILKNNSPSDRTDLSMQYAACIEREDGMELPTKDFRKLNYNTFIFGYTLDELKENCRQYFIKLRIQQPIVEKSPDDGTDSVIVS